MKSRFLFPTLLAVSAATRGFAADAPTSPTPTPSAEPTPAVAAPEQPSMRDALRAQLEEDAKKTAVRPSPPPSVKGRITSAPPKFSPAAPTSPSAKSSATSPSPIPAPATTATDTAANAKDPSVTMMPKVEVRRERITEVDRAVHAKDLEIAKETEKTQATETDKTLNNPKISGGVMSIFGGRSSDVGEGLASQRVSLLEIERDLVAEIALAKTKEEKADLQKQLDEIKAMRRDLDKPR